jgi:hypothetical protein
LDYAFCFDLAKRFRLNIAATAVAQGYSAQAPFPESLPKLLFRYFPAVLFRFFIIWPENINPERSFIAENQDIMDKFRIRGFCILH